MAPKNDPLGDGRLHWFEAKPAPWRMYQVARWRFLTLWEIVRPLTVADRLVIAYDAAERSAESDR